MYVASQMWVIRNKRVAAIGVAVGLALGVGFTPTPVAADTPTAQIACKNAIIGGKKKCIAAGQFCARKHQADYKKYGYSCSKKDKNGRYHLKKI
jgi:hypothetical protein